MKLIKALLIILLLVLIGGLGYGFYLLNTLDNRVNSAMQPVTDLNRDLTTQVSKILHPTPTIRPDPVTIIHAVTPLARLETIQFSVEKVLSAEVNQGMLQNIIGDRLLFIAHGTVIAGVDLTKLNPEDLQQVEGGLVLDLPAPEIFIAALDNQKSYVYDRDTGIFTKGDPQLETEVRKAAEREIRQAALDDQILEQASTNAVAYLQVFLDKLGYSNITVLP